MPTLVEIGPSNASQGQHRRKDATEQIKNLTLAGSRTKVPGFSSADAITTNLYTYEYTYIHMNIHMNDAYKIVSLKMLIVSAYTMLTIENQISVIYFILRPCSFLFIFCFKSEMMNDIFLNANLA